MKSYLNSIFCRCKIASYNDVVSWWNKGRFLLNVILLGITIIHLLILILVFGNGWVFFLLPFILLIWMVVNVLFSTGLIFELVAKKVFKSKIDFDKIAPSIKESQFFILVVIVFLVSIWHLLKQ